MKKTTKILSLLMALVMIFSLTTVALADDAEVTLGTTSKNGVTLQEGMPTSYLNGLAPSYDTANKAVDETGNFQRLPIAGTGNAIMNPRFYAVPKTGSVKVSKDGVIGDLSFSLSSWKGSSYTGATCLQFNYTALAEGSVDVTLTYYYNFNQSGVINGTAWYKETATFTVNVGDGEVDPANKPDKPTVSDVKRFRDYVNSTSSSMGAVYMWCDTYDHQAWFDYITEVDDAYTLGDVVANDGSVLSKSTYPWVCVMTLDANKYLDAYNDELGGECGTHYLKDGQAATETATWYYNANLSKWQFRSAEAPVYIDITHNAPTPAVTEYTVTYTDGVDGAAFANQTYTVKEGDATPAFEGTPAREGYVFLGWEPKVAETVTGNATYTAKWEEALTEVKVTANKGEGALLFLGDEIKVTVKTNVKADNIKITPTLNGAFTQVASDTAADGTKTIWYRVTKIIGNYTTLSFTATATKGDQPAVTDTLSFGVNLRNRIHVTVTKKVSGETVTDATVQLMHKYPQWNSCPMLKYDAVNKEYVMANPWNFSNQPFAKLVIKHGEDEFTVTKDKNGKDLVKVCQAGTEEVYVEYIIVDPIKVTININGQLYKAETFKGNEGDVLDYTAMVKDAMEHLNYTFINVTTEGLVNDAATFGECTDVVINITTKTTGTITGTGDNFVSGN